MNAELKTELFKLRDMLRNMQEHSAGGKALQVLEQLLCEEKLPENKLPVFTLKELAENAILQRKSAAVKGLQTGFEMLDEISGGFLPGELIILGGRPGMGKGDFVLSLALNLAQEQKKVMIFSLENNREQIGSRFLRFFEGEPDNDLIDRAENIKVIDKPTITASQIGEMIKSLPESERPDLVMIDYLHQVKATGRRKNREEEIAGISAELKQIARVTGIPMLAVSPLSRAVETRGGDKRPQLSDLRESGALEQDADKVLFLYRPEYYGIREDFEGKCMIGVAYIIIAKNRSGKLGDALLSYRAETGLYKSLKPEELHLGDISPTPF